MAIHDFSAERLFVEASLTSGAEIICSSTQTNYLINVLRLKLNDEILIFNGIDGEWRARISMLSRRSCTLVASQQTREQVAGPDLEYLFAPLKRARLDYMVQKAVEMGVRSLRPVLTRRTTPDRVNLHRMRANAIEAAEQCGILHLPRIEEPRKFAAVLESWSEERTLIVCDESAPQSNPVDALRSVQPGPIAVLVGPEGGFDTEERNQLLAHPKVCTISLGPRIMRADTAAVAALALVNACLGDWN